MKKKLEEIPQTPGVYLFKNEKGEILYVGKAIDLAKRVKSYFNKKEKPESKIRRLVQEIRDLDYIPVASEFEALLLEASLIKKHQPKFNSKAKDDKSFLYMAMTKEPFPRVLVARKNDFPKVASLFGPFPSARTTRQVVKFLRRIFPFCSQKLGSRPCFHSHLGLCEPCPSFIVKLKEEQQKPLRKKYLENIRHLKRILTGESFSLRKELTTLMKEKARKQEYEEAANLRDQIIRLKWLTSPGYQISFYLENPYFWEETLKSQTESLREWLQPYFSELRTLVRVEGYDISNLGGRKATGSLVVFENGLAAKDKYRRFKIRSKERPDDTLMLKEVLLRRFGHPEWEFPDLLVVDGGKGQVKAAEKVLSELGLKIPVVGLAKRLENIIIPQKTQKGRKIIIDYAQRNLPSDSIALNFLKRLRDEAHRFARAYHLKLRRLI